MKKRILLVFGTRPEAIKMAPLCSELAARPDQFEARVCVTAQHREMLDQVLDFFGIVPDYDLDLMRPGQSLHTITADILTGLKPIIEEFRPDYTLVHGDTATSTAAALACYFSHLKVGHVEAGLRTYDKWSPFPEELNRQITGRIADLHFAPTEAARQNLMSEKTEPQNIVVTGNTVIDALQMSVAKVNATEYTNPEIDKLREIIGQGPNYDEFILVTGHRRENFGRGFINICHALKNIVSARPQTKIIYPVHLNPNVQEPVRQILGQVAGIHLIAPLSYPSFVWAMDKARLIITDSGGVQEEAPSLGKPVLVMRDTTERPEAVEAGTVILVGTDRERIRTQALELLSNPVRYNAMTHINNPYGDGTASCRIADHLLRN